VNSENRIDSLTQLKSLELWHPVLRRYSALEKGWGWERRLVREALPFGVLGLIGMRGFGDYGTGVSGRRRLLEPAGDFGVVGRACR